MESFYALALALVAFWAGRRTARASPVDVAAAAVALGAAAKKRVRGLLDRCCDFSARPIPLPGRGSFCVAWAATAAEKRAVAWLYQTAEAPDRLDWRDCLARYGLARVPAHTLKWAPAGGAPTTAAVTIDLAAGRYAVLRTTGNGAVTSVEGEIALGALAPAHLLGCR